MQRQMEQQRQEQQRQFEQQRHQQQEMMEQQRLQQHQEMETLAARATDNAEPAGVSIEIEIDTD